MNTSAVGALPGSPPQAPSPSSTPGRESGDGNAFARLLEGRPQPEGARPGKPVETGKASRVGADDRRQPGDGTGASDEASASAPEETLAAASDSDAGTDSDDMAEDGAGAEAAWPPPGLGWLLQPPAEPSVPATTGINPTATALGGDAATDADADAAPESVIGNGTALPRLGDTLQAGNGQSTSLQPAEGAGPELAPADQAGAGRGGDAARLLQQLQPTATTTDASAPAFVLPAAPANPVASAPALPAAPASLPTPQLNAPGFTEDVGAHVEWLAGQKLSHAVIRIAPQDLGPIEVRLQLDGERLSADFSSAQAEVRVALEQGMPRLREMLGQHGFELAHAGVGDGQAGDREAPPRGRHGATGELAADEPAPAPVRVLRRGLLDAYA
ncbi:Flagellar hook-length control protein-like, C-terminal domain [Pseudoxanthomonas suwonensis 11-1]|uniref:Flagellar hook-length control protein-like, C-terminal domain n=1 Tax=Pseudoxanthomonas suwonensis (strain 11-1) TaxID=743721 RepID=E6WSQ2_PSEUU|nr:flagellar hook-length control protein FliK [Pseudoxanthomonas suwonensis]ADV27339.1 Flagellar hook-length control protein-like, C-terminal domain [Pseudoxanthomonas suwonensis 11-1]